VWDWLRLTGIGFGLVLLLADECRKAVARHRRLPHSLEADIAAPGIKPVNFLSREKARNV
jgi:hypothetical protein